jgi:hypothetical protein
VILSAVHWVPYARQGPANARQTPLPKEWNKLNTPKSKLILRGKAPTEDLSLWVAAMLTRGLERSNTALHQ